MNKTKPVIGITLDHEPDGSYSKFPFYALRENYASSVSKAGGIPVALSHELELCDEYLKMIDGLIITGGAFDIDPSFYGEKKHETVTLKNTRTQFEWKICQGALDNNIPVLGICGGQQLLNVVLGGNLIQHIPDAVKDCLAHEQPNPRNEAGHAVEVETDSRLFEIVKTKTMMVNSAHHQAVLDTKHPVMKTAFASDGIVEAIEDPTRYFCLGVQWHPEFLIDDGDLKIFEAFVLASGRNA